MAGDPILTRTLFYETTMRDDGVNYNQIRRYYPFYLVNTANFAKCFEPCDMRRDELGQYGKKEVGVIKPLSHPKSLFGCESKPDGQDLILHSFDWDWPL